MIYPSFYRKFVLLFEKSNTSCKQIYFWRISVLMDQDFVPSLCFHNQWNQVTSKTSHSLIMVKYRNTFGSFRSYVFIGRISAISNLRIRIFVTWKHCKNIIIMRTLYDLPNVSHFSFNVYLLTCWFHFK